MTDRELMQQALDALETKGEHHPRVYEAIAALRERLAQPEKKEEWQYVPKLNAFSYPSLGLMGGDKFVSKDSISEQRFYKEERHMTDHELRDCPRCGHCCPQPEQEPVAWANQDDLQNFDMRVRTNRDTYHTVPLYTTPPAAQPFWDLFDENQRLRAELKFNTTPPQQWVGLTDEEIENFVAHLYPLPEKPVRERLQALLTKLRERNT